MVAGDPECYPVMFVYTPDGFPHKTGPFNGFGRYYEYFKHRLQSNTTVEHSSLESGAVKEKHDYMNRLTRL